MSFSLLIIMFLSYDCKKIKAYTSFPENKLRDNITCSRNLLENHCNIKQSVRISSNIMYTVCYKFISRFCRGLINYYPAWKK